LLRLAPGKILAQGHGFALAALGFLLLAAPSPSRFAGGVERGFGFGRGWPVVMACHENRLGREPG
jgi:hypothetical protein